MEICKCIIPAAGLGTGFLPFTKSIPKEMLPLLNKPIIQYIVEEALQAEMKHLLFVVNGRKTVIADHFDEETSLSALLSERNQEHLLNHLNRISRQASYTFLRQPDPIGTGHAVLLARHCIEKEYFCVAYPDGIFDGPESVLKQLTRVARQEKASVIAVYDIPNSQAPFCSVATAKKILSTDLGHLSCITDNPRPRDTSSTLAIAGRYVLSHRIFTALDYFNTHSEKEEVSLHDAINQMVHEGERVLTYKVKVARYDLSTQLGWLKSTIQLALKDPALAPHIKALFSETKSPLITPPFSPTHHVEKSC
ncbi:TPA: UTP--glucose-1-phosphate uridylyltransferase [Candidatus Dependentiae bacterium]|nr:MAG: UTP-glucose-1-phosphate uridylyltransferase [candidate division TM6 bacterium GW2011_GWF2_43_87]HBL98799.1 UTP--glucose-1-phosphate uridylyltransferase [Candidatus Dependentiae bacterium]